MDEERDLELGQSSISLLDDQDGEDDERESSLFLPQKNPTASVPLDVDPAAPPTSTSSFPRLLALAKPEAFLLIAGLIFLAISSLSTLIIPAYSGKIIDTILPTLATANSTSPADSSSRSHELNKAVIIAISAFAAGAIASGLRAYCFVVAGERTVARLRKQLFSSILIQEIAFYDQNKTGELINRLSSDCEVLQSTVSVNVSMGLRFVAQAIGGTIILFYISWSLTLIMLSVFPPIIVGAVIYGKYVKRISKEKQDALARSTDVADEAFSMIRTVKSFASENVEKEAFFTKVDNSFAIAKKFALANGIFVAAGTFGGFVSLILVLWYGARQVIAGDLSAGTLTSFILYTLTVAVSFGALSSLYADFMKAVGASTRVFQLLDRNPQVKYNQGTKLNKTQLKGKIELENVSFSYPTRPNSQVLSNFNLTLSPGECVALVGHSGGGKSTVVSLIEQFYYPTQGKILIDGRDLMSINTKHWRRNVGLVAQEPSLFAVTIKDNILYGLESRKKQALVTQSEIEQVAKQANAHDFISRLENGYDTLVGERGIQLSGGQKQRIAIARALLKDPKVLLLDEATSALDAESEWLVQEALERLMVGRTVLVIAHRLSTVKRANRVVVVESGTVVEAGTHEELIEKDGVYKKLVRRQLSAEGQLGAEKEKVEEVVNGGLQQRRKEKEENNFESLL
eukprot:TRINITY_DN2070_c0_g1_i3.p1 TRINITY_DN2070_c0_g1~~TRINITY_DN2070_c0_g1_i3.p1  ORF type:complete len:685 (+),score=188.50 TRINITY_DN2070_c0_g1_i3:60-2114(+)